MLLLLGLSGIQKTITSVVCVFLLVFLFVGSVTGYSFVFASTDVELPKPSVPEFTVELINSSYDVPQSSFIDPYAGKTVVEDGYHFESRTIEFKIKNQPVLSSWIHDNPEVADWTVDFFYNIRYKGHFSEDWTNMFIASDGYMRQDYGSDYTVWSYQGKYSSTDGLEFNGGSVRTNFSADAHVDFQVKAMIGSVSRVPNPNATEPLSAYPWRFTGETSDWSPTQTIVFSETDEVIPTESLNQHEERFFPIDLLALALGTVAVVIIILIVIKKSLRKVSNE